jgi:hypothetical protein
MPFDHLIPPPTSQEYLWWQAGTLAECRARDEGLSISTIEVRDTLEALAKLRNASGPDQEGLTLALARIFCPDKLRRKFR